MADRTVFQARAWVDFLHESQHAEPVIAEVLRGRTTVGWFTGAIVRRFGLRILGSPLRGWTTSYMGCNIVEPTDRPAAFAALPRFAFDELRCAHLEVMDRYLEAGDLAVGGGYRVDLFRGFELEIDRGDDELLDAMTKSGRRDVRRSVRNGIDVELVDLSSDMAFAVEFYRQVTEAFAKRSLVPTFPLERVTTMIRHLAPTGHLVALRAYDPAGRPAATGLFPGLPGHAAFFWMGASRRSAQHLLPNEALMWSALRTWRDRGALRFDFGGHGAFKAKYGGSAIEVPWLRRSRRAWMEAGRSAAERTARHAQVRAGRRR